MFIETYHILFVLFPVYICAVVQIYFLRNDVKNVQYIKYQVWILAVFWEIILCLLAGINMTPVMTILCAVMIQEIMCSN